jgi:2,4-dienoyl-CoA reductase-like NADH-dependent reductase (Old Yellow Enzyme family)
VSDQPGVQRYPHVFEPIRVGPLELPNRMYFSPHGIPLEAPTPGVEAHRVPAVEMAHYLAERAAGGVGIVFHSTQIAPWARQFNLMTSPGLPESVPSYRRVADLTHEAGGRIMAEVWYVSWLPKSWEPLGPEAPSFAPTASQQFDYPTVRRAMGTYELRQFVDAHRTAARHLREAGYDGMELHVAHGALLEYFLSPYFNRRTDEYGGSLENRARLLRECIEACREELSDEMALGIRLTVDQKLPGGWGPDDTKEILEHLKERTGVIDFVDLEISVEPEQGHLMITTYWEPRFHKWDDVAKVGPYARELGYVVGTVPGQLTSIADAERMIASGVVDMIGATRGFIAEPYLVKHALEGRERESRRCIQANHCGEGALTGGFGCAINPAAGKEARWAVERLAPAPRSMNVTVVGGGPAGAEAALVAAQRGHTVTLLERRDRLGGGVELWARIPGREHFSTMGAWYGRRLADLGVDVQTGAEATADAIAARAPDVVVVATGAEYARDGESAFLPREIAGWDREFVIRLEDVLEHGRTLSGRVVVLDEEGFHAAVGVAEMAAAAGAEVELVTRKQAPGAGTMVQLLYILPRLHAAGVKVSPMTYLSQIGDGSVTLQDVRGGGERTVDGVDTVVLATMRKPIDTLAVELEGRVPFVYLVGDALAPRGLREATYEGHRFGRVIGEPDMPATVVEELFRPLSPLLPAEVA